MIHFDFLERHGIRAAAFTDKTDGDCGLRAASPDARLTAVARAGGDPERLVCPSQVHEARVAAVSAADGGRGADGLASAIPDTDGLVTNTPGLPLGITAADCVPVYLFDPNTRSGGVLHAGREGTFKNIASSGVGALVEQYGARPQDIIAVIGPSAGPCCYEVPDEMAAAWRAAGHVAEKDHLDLWHTNRKQLVGAGLLEHHIEITGRCTICAGAFFSYRTDKSMDRNLALLIL